jgi:L-alanine-DL-glutamate epimerase-like enolase superfamily enzyme
VRARVEQVALPLREPFRAAWGALEVRDVLLLRLRDEDGIEGVGEAAPLEPYDGVSLEGCRAGLERAALALERGAGSTAAREAGSSPGMAAVDVALLDLRARQERVPVWALFASDPQPEIEVNATVGAEDRAGVVAAVVSARERGFGCVKLKVGIGDDAGRVAAGRAAAGPNMALRVDANGAWDVEQATVALRALAPSDIELCEEPVHGAEALAAVRARSEVPIAADESGVQAASSVDAVCLKLSRCGGVSGLLAAAAEARAAGAEVYLASSLDGPVGIAAALHAAAVLRPDRASGLATLDLFDDGAGARALEPLAGRLSVPDGVGLGL